MENLANGVQSLGFDDELNQWIESKGVDSSLASKSEETDRELLEKKFKLYELQTELNDKVLFFLEAIPWEVLDQFPDYNATELLELKIYKKRVNAIILFTKNKLAAYQQKEGNNEASEGEKSKLHKIPSELNGKLFSTLNAYPVNVISRRFSACDSEVLNRLKSFNDQVNVAISQMDSKLAAYQKKLTTVGYEPQQTSPTQDSHNPKLSPPLSRSAAAPSNSQPKRPLSACFGPRITDAQQPSTLAQSAVEQKKPSVASVLPRVTENHSEPKNRATSNSKGEENVRQNNEKKRSLEDGEEDDVEKKEQVIPKPTKKIRTITPDDNSDGSGDEHKPGSEKNGEVDEALLSRAATKSKPATESDEDESRKLSNGKSRGRSTGKKSIGNKSIVKVLTFNEQSSEKASDTQLWSHLLDFFLMPGQIKDNEKRSIDHPDYDPKTLFVPPISFLNKQMPIMRQWWFLKSEHHDVVLFFKNGKFYELYHMDAVTGFTELSLTYMKQNFACVKIPENEYGRYSASLIEKGYKVGRIEETGTPDIMKERVKQMSELTKFDEVVKREICQISTTATRVYTSRDSEPSVVASTYLLAIVEKRMSRQVTSTYGVCFIDTTIGDSNLGN